MGKLTFCIVLAVVYLSLPVHSSVITTTNDVIHCDGIICPVGSTTCIVLNRTFSDLTSYKYIRLCADAAGTVTLKVEKELPNPNPGMEMNSYSLSSGNRELTEEEQIELDASINKMTQDTKQWTKDFNEDLRNQFPPRFPFNQI